MPTWLEFRRVLCRSRRAVRGCLDGVVEVRRGLEEIDAGKDLLEVHLTLNVGVAAVGRAGESYDRAGGGPLITLGRNGDDAGAARGPAPEHAVAGVAAPNGAHVAAGDANEIGAHAPA